MENNRCIGALDWFRLIAALLVIAIHTSPLSSFNADADFVFTRIIARIAVPFFLMVTGYFLLPQFLFERKKDLRPIGNFLWKTLFLYVVASAMYLPINLYAEKFHGMDIAAFLRMIAFDGTFYHLWYLPALMLGVLLIFLLVQKLRYGLILGIAAFLYVLGLLGDSYYGLVERLPAVRTIFNGFFRVFSYMRNGLFYAPIFLVMGAGLYQRCCSNRAFLITGLVLAVAMLIIEGMTLRFYEMQRHDSMYLALIPCMCCLFQLILSIKANAAAALRAVSMGIYVIHPMAIVLVRGAAKLTGLEHLFIENSVAHFLAVCLLSGAAAAFLAVMYKRLHKQAFHRGRAWIELDMVNLQQNVMELQRLLPPGGELMPTIKANAYGHGAVLIAKELYWYGIRNFCVATVLEGVELRRHGVKGNILILGYSHPEQFFLLRKYRLTQTVIDHQYALLLNSYGKKIKVQLKIDTGMHRLGERSEQIDSICDVFCYENLHIEGVYTHLCSDETRKEQDLAFTNKQASAFFAVVDELEKRGCSCGKVHLLASYGLIRYPELGGDFARIGIALYGVLSNRKDLETCPVKLRPVLSLKARIALTKDLHAGEAAGYGLQYVAETERRIAVLSIGYADGIPRALSSGKGSVLINGAEAPIIGRICMDQMIVDITGIPNVNAGDIAVLIGKSGSCEITVYDLAEKSGTITNELLSRLSNRIERIAV